LEDPIVILTPDQIADSELESIDEGITLPAAGVDRGEWEEVP